MLLLLILLLRGWLPLRLHLRDAIKEFLQEYLNLARFPEIGSKTLQVNLHIMDFVRNGEILVEIQKTDHRTERLLELGSFLF